MENDNKNENIESFYQKDKQDGTKKNEKKAPKTKKVKSKISKIILLIIVIVLVILIGVCIFKFVYKKMNKTNLNYPMNMEDYGFDVMYDNKTANPEDRVTKSEAIKMVVTSMLNENDITKLIEIREFVKDYNETMTSEEMEEKLEYKNQLWVEYAVSIGMIQRGEITKDNANSNATFLESLVYFANAKTKILNQVLDTQKDIQVKNIDSYRVSEQLALNDMIYNAIIENKDDNYRKTVTKKEFNKLVIDMVIKYNTITVEGEKININKDKEPSNVDEYPYTLASIDKRIYELKNFVANKDEYKNAKESYAELKKYYYDVNSIIQDYMNAILNVDYNKFDEESFKTKILDLSFHYENESNVDEYIKYVKDNKIKISGNAKVQYPAIYFDGESYRVRVKVDYKIESANSKENILYGDLSSKNTISYDKDEDSLIVDVPFKKAIVNELVYLDINALKNIIAGQVKQDSKKVKVEDVQGENKSQENSSNDTDNFIPTESEIVQEGDTLVVTPK